MSLCYYVGFCHLIQILLELKWWDFPEEKLVEFLPLLCDPDLENVQQRLKQELLK